MKILEPAASLTKLQISYGSWAAMASKELNLPGNPADGYSEEPACICHGFGFLSGR
jgi:hypothetical protein